MMHARSLLFSALLATCSGTAFAITPTLPDALSERVIQWRRDFHQHPELGNAEFRTAGIVATHLKKLGLDVKTGIGGTGVVAILKGGHAGPRLALRADMDALPVAEQTGLPYASQVTSDYRGQPVGVMHACGHDMHVAILMGVAEALVSQRDTLAGEVMFIFQPAEEGPPVAGEVAGAKRMLDEGLFSQFQPDAVFGLHVWAGLKVGQVGLRSGALMASADEWTLTVEGKQTHGSRPWDGIDPITVAAQIHLAAQSILARQIDITNAPVVLTTGQFQSGVRFNIIPDSAQLVGTLRTFDMDVRDDVIQRFRKTAELIAQAAGASATLNVVNNAPTTENNDDLYRQYRPVLEHALGANNVIEMPRVTVAEDFSQLANASRGLFFFVGTTPSDKDPTDMPINHSPFYAPDEAALDVGLRALLQLSVEFLRPASP